MHVFDKRHVHGAWEKKYAMLVKPSLKEEIEGLFHLLADSSTTEAFVLAATLVRQRLERLREFQFLAAISNYLGLKYPFHYGASDIPGAIPCTQPLERQNREYHTVIPMAASHEAMLHTNLFNLLKNIAWKNSETVIQYKLSKIALVQYQAAAALVRANIKPVFVGAYHGEDGHNFHVWYLNATAGGKKTLSEVRIMGYKAYLHGNATIIKTLTQLKDAKSNIVEVFFRINEHESPDIENESSCNCEVFQKTRMCPHLLAVQHMEKYVDVFEMIKPAYPHNKKPRRTLGRS